MLPKLLHREVALLLTEVSVQCFGIVTIPYQLVSNLLGLHLCAAKDDGKDTWIIVDNTFQSQVFIPCIHEIVYVIDLLCTLVTTSYDDFLIIIEVTFSNLFYLPTHRCREKQGVASSRKPLENLVDTVRKTHIEHLIGLIQHHVVHRI